MTGGPITGTTFNPVTFPSKVESVITTLPTGDGGSPELWKLNHYYERLDEWYAERGVVDEHAAKIPASEPVWEMHNLTQDPEERQNRASEDLDVRGQLQTVLDAQRDRKRLLPQHGNPSPPPRPS